MDIKIILGEGGCLEDVFVSPELKDADVEIIDFCTQDPDEVDDANERYDEAKSLIEKGDLISVY